MLTVTTHNLANTVVLRCGRRLVRGDESALLCAAVQHYGKDIVLDLGGIIAIDAAGIGALMSLQAAGVYLKLMNPPESVRSVLRLTGLAAVFEIGEAESIQEVLQRAATDRIDFDFPSKKPTPEAPVPTILR